MYYPILKNNVYVVMTVSQLPYLPEFFDRYITLIPSEATLMSQFEEAKTQMERIRPSLIQFENYRYQPHKWTPKDILQHLIDNERIQSYRALAFARGETASLPGYNENSYAENTLAEGRNITDLLDEFYLVRESSRVLFDSFSEAQLLREGICSNIKITVLALGFQIIGHQFHHQTVLKERYFQ